MGPEDSAHWASGQGVASREGWKGLVVSECAETLHHFLPRKVKGHHWKWMEKGCHAVRPLELEAGGCCGQAEAQFFVRVPLRLF